MDQTATIVASYNSADGIKSKSFYIIVLASSPIITEDKTPPIISGLGDMEIFLGSELDLLALALGVDDVDGQVDVTIKESNLDVKNIGIYTVTFFAVDKAGNTATLTITITVKEFVDITPPRIYGIETLEIAVGTEVDLLRYAYAEDDIDGLVTVLVKESNLDINNPGIYNIVYQAIDKAGNKSTFNMTVEVIIVEVKKIYIEDFSKIPSTGSAYKSQSFVGNYDFIWEATGFRSDLELDGKALTFGGKTSDYSSIKTKLTGGISYFSVELKKAYTSANVRNVALIINDDIVAEFSLDVEDLDLQFFEVELNIHGDYSLELAQIDTTSDRAQITIDNLKIITNPKSTQSIEEQNLNKDFESLTIPSSYIEAGNIHLANIGYFGSEIAWKYTNPLDSFNHLVNLTTGFVSMPLNGVVEVQIDAIIQNGTHQIIKTFTIKIGEGSPSLIKDVLKTVDNQKVKIKGIISSVYYTSNGKRIFIQDETNGILVYINSNIETIIGNEIELVGEKKSNNGIIYIDNISKVNIEQATKTLEVINLKNNNLENILGKLVNLNGLLKFSFGNINTYTLINEYGEFSVYIDEIINDSSAIKSKLSFKPTGLEVDVFGIVYFHDGIYKIYLTNLSDLEVSDNLDLNRIDNVIHQNLSFLDDGSLVKNNLLFITTSDLFIDLRIEWTSSNQAILNNYGVIYPSSEDISLVLNYKIYIENTLISSHNLNLTVVKRSPYIGYYARIEGLSGAALRSELNSLISKMKSYSYTNTSYVLEDSDADLNKPGQLLLMYSGTNARNVWGSNWNKEHIWPQSKLGSASKSDIHNLRACDSGINSSRGNLAFAEGSGRYGAVSGGWYPGDSQKGDVARIVLYMNIRWNLGIVKGVIGDLDMFLKWHIEDPVDDFERNRNEVIFSNQQNRNPFIDHPELVELVYGEVKLKSFNHEEKNNTNTIIYLNILMTNSFDLLNRKVA